MKVSDTLLQQGRALEWLTSAVILIFAITLALPGDTLATSSAFMAFRVLGAEEATMAVPLTIIGSMRMAGLWINGNWQRSPLLRCIGAVFGAGLFAWLAMLFSVPYLSGQTAALTTGVGTYLVLALFDILAAYRSAADVANSQRH
ncbi:hypothetical protein Q4577_22885 [Marinovum sp. 2_MG-2023]|uniref:hypothetical protein n=1 Tax=unclassified Marinovum TaxID=2647166 RepID=UPI0026E14FDD|nr:MULTISPECIES: hypothetical protein [unclassified Marinovum]MDO6732864.1 hypothetical protein [Marinovum sp. 2_MG-2023]MDO6782142.1 hypothetical protein [Marinovum sp. 1_MG-2023]